MPPLPPAVPPPDGDPTDLTTGIHLTEEGWRLAVVVELRQQRAAIEELVRTTPWLVLRELLAAPVWPGKAELRVGTVLVLGAALVLAFGSERVAGWLPGLWAVGGAP